MTNIVYIAHSKQRIRRAAKYSILTLLNYSQYFDFDHQIIVYTDAPVMFEDLDIRIEDIDELTLEVWLGENLSNERMKMNAAYDTVNTYGGSVVFVESETFFCQNPNDLFKSLTAENCMVYADLDNKKINLSSIKKSLTKLAEYGQPAIGNSADQYYSTSVFGLHEQNSSLLKRAIKALDKTKANHTVENPVDQYISSLIFKQTLEPVYANMYICNWAGRNKNVKQLLKKFFQANEHKGLDDLIEKATDFIPKVQDARSNNELNILDRVIDLISD